MNRSEFKNLIPNQKVKFKTNNGKDLFLIFKHRVNSEYTFLVCDLDYKPMGNTLVLTDSKAVV